MAKFKIVDAGVNLGKLPGASGREVERERRREFSKPPREEGEVLSGKFKSRVRTMAQTEFAVNHALAASLEFVASKRRKVSSEVLLDHHQTHRPRRTPETRSPTDCARAPGAASRATGLSGQGKA
jgi:hypothetical protein